MTPGFRLILSLLSMLLLTSVVIAAAPTEFCKCTCGSNSTILALDDVPKPDDPEPTIDPSTISKDDTDDVDGAKDDASDSSRRVMRALLGLQSRTAHTESATCNDCSKQFCLDQNLTICTDVEDKDIFTECFQRDSTKDEAIVLIFIFATAGLLLYAAFRPWVDQWIANARDRGTYIPVSENGI